MQNQHRKMTFARALFDNYAEMPRELSFKKGDILTVLQEKYDEYPDWWVCSLRNKVGLAPANRLEVMPVLLDRGSRPPVLSSQMSVSLYDELPDRSGQGNDAETYSYFNMPPPPPTANSRRGHSSVTGTYANITSPQVAARSDSHDDLYSTYQMPLELAPSSNYEQQSDYQVPLDPETAGNNSSAYFNFSGSSGLSSANPTSNSIANRTSGYSSLQSAGQSNADYHQDRVDYTDAFLIPSMGGHNQAGSSNSSAATTANSFSMCSSSSNSDFSLPSELGSKIWTLPPNMSFQEILDKFQLLNLALGQSCQRVIDFVKPKWSSVDALRTTVKSLEIAFPEVYVDLGAVVEFGHGVLERSQRCGDRELTRRLYRQLCQLEEAHMTMRECLDQLTDGLQWRPDMMADAVRLAVCEGRDCLSRMVGATRNCIIQLRSLSVTVNGNASVLFASRPDSQPPTPGTQLSTPLAGGTDVYVSLTGKRDTIPTMASAAAPTSTPVSSEVREVMRLFLSQTESQTTLAVRTVEEFLAVLRPGAVGSTETVVAHSRFVIRTGTQLVCIAKNLADSRIQSVQTGEIEIAGNRLCDSLKMIVNTVKTIVSEGCVSAYNLRELTTTLNSLKSYCQSVQNVVIDSTSWSST